MVSTKIYNDLIDDLIETSKLPISVKTELKNYKNKVSDLIPIVYEPEDFSNWGPDLNEKVIDLHAETFNVKRIGKLHDGTFLIMSDDGETFHYDRSFSLKKFIPFKYATPITTEYISPADLSIIPITEGGLPASLICMAVPSAHIIQLYKYKSGIWSHFKTLGTVSTPGYLSGFLDTPVSVTGGCVTNIIQVFVSCLGPGPNALIPSFIKRFELDLNSNITSETILTYPGEKGYLGSMKNSEIQAAARIRLLNSNRLVVRSLFQTIPEIGVFQDVVDTTPVIDTFNMRSGIFQELPFSDEFLIPDCFASTGSKVVIGDSLGHLGLTGFDLNNTSQFYGRRKGVNDSSEYELQHKAVDDILIDGDDLYFISDKKLYHSNFLNVKDSEVLYTLQPLSFAYEIEEVVGFVSAGKISISIGSGRFQSVCDIIDSTVVPTNTSLKIKIEVGTNDFLNGKIELQKGVLIIKPL